MKKTNQKLVDTIKGLKDKSRKEDIPLFKRLAKELNKPKRRKVEVNVGKINRYTEKGDVVVIPGKVLSVGFLDHKVKVIAWNYSKKAKEKIEEKGKAVDLTDYMSKKKLDKGIKILI
ncbi:MAG: 50S ribosomal protein L18e [Candidatus Woesearchaeota archaeon]